jgi:hypothetical protein
VKAGDLGERFFFETLVRIHRRGEGAPYTMASRESKGGGDRFSWKHAGSVISIPEFTSWGTSVFIPFGRRSGSGPGSGDGRWLAQGEM